MLFSALCAPLFALGAYAVGVLAVSAVSDATHDLSAAYDLTQSVSPNIEDIANIKLPRDLAAAHPQHEPKFRHCSPWQVGKLDRAIQSYRKYIAGAVRYLETEGPGTYYKDWFGEPDDGRVSAVYRVFRRLKNYDLSDYTFDCRCRDPLPHLRIDGPRRIILLCAEFWDFRPDGQDESQAILMIAATCRLPQNGGLQDLAEGWDDSEALALSNPDDAVKNADSYIEFVVKVNGLLVVEAVEE